MSYLDSNGIMMLEETDSISPFQTLINGMQAATSNVIAELQTLAEDTGWINLNPNAGYAVSSGQQTRIRRIGSTVITNGLVTPSGGSWLAGTNLSGIFTLPTGFRPAHDLFAPGAGTSGTAGGTLTVRTSGSLDIRIGYTDTSFISITASWFV